MTAPTTLDLIEQATAKADRLERAKHHLEALVRYRQRDLVGENLENARGQMAVRRLDATEEAVRVVSVQLEEHREDIEGLVMGDEEAIRYLAGATPTEEESATLRCDCPLHHGKRVPFRDPGAGDQAVGSQ